ncbi:MAG: phosphopyruvate hydratase [Candidatus Moranbacteria bacterium]|nr:phosphopyruvate hydratase [Candidatus Moranbacteria bacterium]
MTDKNTIAEIVAQEILDSRGNPTIAVQVTLKDGTKTKGSVPSGASTGEFEAHELRDNDKKRFGGKGVQTAVKNINGEINALLKGKDATNQEEIDQIMISTDGTPNKKRLGANAILGVSIATCRAGATIKNMPLYQHIADLARNTKEHLTIPTPMFNIINGGKHADSGLSIQEYKMVPDGIKTFPEQYRAGSEIFHKLKEILKNRGLSTSVGDEGGFAPHLESNAEPFDLITQAAEGAGYKMNEDIKIGFDAAANSFMEKENEYFLELEGVRLSGEALVTMYGEWLEKYPILSIEDGLSESDWSGWTAMNTKIGSKTMLIGDDLLVTNVARIQRAIEQNACNTVLIKPNQIGSVTETIKAVALAKKHNMKTMFSHRSGETCDDFIADCSVGTQTEYIKSGAPSRGERVSKYNRLQEIYFQLATKNQ